MGRSRRLWATGLLVGLVGLMGWSGQTSVAQAGQACAPPRIPTVSQATQDRRLDSMFASYGNTGQGWTGGDGTYSAALPGGSELWLFADTFLGPITPPTRPPRAAFVRNALVKQTGRRLVTLHGGTDVVPTSLISPRARTHWYWMGEGNVVGSRLEVPLTEWRWSGIRSSLFPILWVTNDLATFSVDHLRAAPVIRRLPSATGVEWGAWVARDYPYTYIYGVEDLNSKKYMHVARVRGQSLTAHWRFYTGGDPRKPSSWSSHERRSIRVTDAVENEFSVERLRPGLYMLITMDTSYPFSSVMTAYFSCSATGPFVDKTPLFTTPESGLQGIYHNPTVFTYAAHVHPELSTGTHLVASYDVNTLKPRPGGPLWNHVSLYRPRFVEITLRY